MAFECSSSFAISFSITIDASISLTSVTVTTDAEDTDITHFVVAFTYTTGIPPATAFRLSSSSVDELEGIFTPATPQGHGALVRNGSVAGTVVREMSQEGDRIYNGTITVVQE